MDITVGIAELKLTAKRTDLLVTYSLGTCLGLTIYDPVKGVGGMIHAQLPSSSVNAERAAAALAMFIDTGVPMLFQKAYAMGAETKRIIVKIAGCNFNENGDRIFRIGERNHVFIRRLLWKNGIFISGEDIGGNLSRTMALDMGTGIVTVKTGGNITRI